MVEDYIIDFNKIPVNSHKSICVAELEDLIPFNIQRIYWVTYNGIENWVDQHAHISLKQVLVCISGKVKISLESSSGIHSEYLLNRADYGIFIPEKTWKKIEYYEPSIILCMASEKYIENDYIRDYETFKSEILQLI